MAMNQPQTHPESFQHWREHNTLIAPLFGMHSRQQEQIALSAAAMDQLVRGTEHPNPKVRWWCAHLLDHLADERAIAPLLRLSRDPVPRVRAEALHALGCERCKPCGLGVDTVALLIDAALHDESPKVRSTAIGTLAFLSPDPRAAAALERIALADPELDVRRSAQHALKYHTNAKLIATVFASGDMVYRIEEWNATQTEARSDELAQLLQNVVDDGASIGFMALEPRENGRHRAEVQKLMVHTAHRRRGLARQLMQALEETARRANRSLLVLDTRRGDAAETLYHTGGYTQAGIIPRYARSSNGELADTVFFYREL